MGEAGGERREGIARPAVLGWSLAAMNPLVSRFLSLFVLAVSLVAPASAAEGASRKRVAIIFDDGPTPEQNAPLLALLAQEKVRVSFANVGRNVDAHPELARAVVSAGHEIVNHSYTHPHFKELADAAITQEVRDTQEAVRKATGQTPSWFWAPFGDWDDRIAAAIRAGGLEHFPAMRFQFNDTRDWDAATTAEQFRERATRTIARDTVILCHEWPKVTLANLPWVLAELKRQNVEFVTFSELAK